jgi:hypothetical protein
LTHSLDLVAAVHLNYDGCFLLGDFNLNIYWRLEAPEAWTRLPSV